MSHLQNKRSSPSNNNSYWFRKSQHRMFFFHGYLRQNRCFRYFSTCTKSGNYKVHVMLLFQLFTRMFSLSQIAIHLFYPAAILAFPLQLREAWRPWQALTFFQLCIYTCSLCITIEKRAVCRTLLEQSLNYLQTRSRTCTFNTMLYLTGVLKEFPHQTMVKDVSGLECGE